MYKQCASPGCPNASEDGGRSYCFDHVPGKRPHRLPERRSPLSRALRKIVQFWKSRTIKVSALIAVLGAVEASSGYLKTMLPENTFGVVMIGLAVVMAIMRSVTATSIAEK